MAGPQNSRAHSYKKAVKAEHRHAARDASPLLGMQPMEGKRIRNEYQSEYKTKLMTFLLLVFSFLSE